MRFSRIPRTFSLDMQDLFGPRLYNISESVLVFVLAFCLFAMLNVSACRKQTHQNIVLIKEKTAAAGYLNRRKTIRYGYYPDSNACRQKSDVVILVHSKFDNFQKRRRIRNTWASSRTFNGKTFTTVFFLGEPSFSQMEPPKSGSKGEANQSQAWFEKQVRQVDDMRQSIYKEAAAFGDIVMGNFTDAYRNLTIKHIMALHWAVTNCRQVEYIAKVDDDTLVNVFSLARYISGTNRSTSGFLACMLPSIRTPFRKSRVKWFVNETEYPFPVFPLWCMGFGEIMTRDVAQSLLKASRDVRTFWVDDVYVTGLLRHKAGFQVIDMYSIFDYNKTSFFVLPKYVKNYSFKSFWSQIVADNRRNVF